MKFLGSISLVLALAPVVPAFASGITYTCDASIATYGPAGLCPYLNSTVDPLYNTTFTNANANIYIEFSNNGGLADSTSGFYNLVTYSQYETALWNESTDPAKAYVPVTEPSIFGGDNIELTSALAEALGITTVANGNPVLGMTASGVPCTNPGSNGCYNGLIQLNIPADLDSEYGQGYTYRGLGGSTTGTTENYDLFSVVEHETDEILGTASCIETTGANNTLYNQANCASAVDLFRYTSAGERTFDTTGIDGYFSADGGITDFDGNSYNNQANGQDWADFNQYCLFVQDSFGCLNKTIDITTDGPGGTFGPEIAILNAVGYDDSTDSPVPERGTMGMLGLGFAALGFFSYHRRRRLSPK